MPDAGLTRDRSPRTEAASISSTVGNADLRLAGSTRARGRLCHSLWHFFGAGQFCHSLWQKSPGLRVSPKEGNHPANVPCREPLEFGQLTLQFGG